MFNWKVISVKMYLLYPDIAVTVVFHFQLILIRLFSVLNRVYQVSICTLNGMLSDVLIQCVDVTMTLKDVVCFINQ